MDTLLIDHISPKVTKTWALEEFVCCSPIYSNFNLLFVLFENYDIPLFFFYDDDDDDASLETQGQIVGLKTKIKTGGKKFDEQKYERKILFRAFARRTFNPARFDFRLRPHYLPLGLRG